MAVFDSVLTGLRRPVIVDRLVAGLCGVIWLAVVGVGVAATVQLVRMGSGYHSRIDTGSQTPWLLYAVIVVSALVIVAAVPLLMWARRAAEPELVGAAPGQSRSAAASRPGSRPAGAPRVSPATDDVDVRPLLDDESAQEVDRVWWRTTGVTVAAMGVGMLAVAGGTYLMADGRDGAAWIVYGVAAAVTVAMPVIPWLYLRRLQAIIAAAPPRRAAPSSVSPRRWAQIRRWNR